MGRIVFIGFLALVVSGMVVMAFWRDVTTAQSAQDRRFASQLPVTAIAVGTREFADTVEALGDARANESVVITSQDTDVISRVAFDSGDVVATGQVLVELADAEEAADLNEARATLREARNELARVTQLINRGVATRAQSDQAVAAVERAEARVASLEAQLANLLVRAPFDGVIGLRNASPGMLVRPGDAIATLDDISVIKVDFTIPERFLTQAQAGAPLSLAAAAYGDESFVGVITGVDTRVDPTTRAAVVRADIDNADGRLRPGMLMLVEMRRNIRENIAVPEVALLREGEQAFVYVIAAQPVREDESDAEGAPQQRAERRQVQTGLRAEGFVEITSGLAAGERIAADGVHRLRPGAAVRVVGDDQAGQEAPNALARAQGRGA